MNSAQFAIFFTASVVLISNVLADYWSSSIDTNSTHWSIYRECSNISFDLSSLVEGKISSVESHGRIINPYQSYYAEVGTNDVRLRERTNALKGSYKSTDEIKMQSAVYPNEIDILVDKPIGTDIYTFEYRNEQWPVSIKASRTIDYSGQRINDRSFEGNNGDFVGTDFLYNRELCKEQKSVIWLQRMNATVRATNESILRAEFKPTKYLGYLIRASSASTADLIYRQRDPQYDVKHQNYPALNEGCERYFGTINLSRKIEMRSLNEIPEDDDGWLSCCYGCGNDMEYFDQRDFGANAHNIFCCACYKGPIDI